MTSPGRAELGGIESETFDFSQLEEYINDDNENNIYFHDALVTSSDLKLPTDTTDKTHHYGRHLSEKSVGVHAAEGTEGRGHISGGNPCVPQAAGNPVHSSVNQHHKAYGVRNGRNNSIDVSSSFTKPHHLPDSPPDSGSEPPFSPPNEGVPKLKCPSLDLLPHPLPIDLPDGLKHYVYKHDISSTSPTSSSSSPHHPHHHHHMRHQPPSSPVHSAHSASMPVLTPLSAGQPLQMPVMTSYPLQQQVMTPHLGHLYAGSDEFLYDNLAVSSTTTCKKRKLPDSPKTHRNGIHVKVEPSVPSPDPTTTVLPSGDEDYTFELSAAEASALFVDSSFQCIRFQTFQPNTWVQLLDKDMKEIPSPNFRVDADKGFNYSNADESFVCQKKNHFQVTAHVQPLADARYYRAPQEGGNAPPRPIEHFSLHFHGVKMESPTQTIKVEQSQSDRSKRPFHPVPLEMVRDQVTKTTVGRLHFSETTSNNMRKKGKPNPDQRFFFLVVSLCAHAHDATSATVAAHASEKIIVRASNPGQFENDMELSWQKGQTLDSIFHNGRVGINTDRPEESLVVHGNIKVTGHILQPSDFRAKYDIHELDPSEQLRNVSRLRIVRYRYLPEFVDHSPGGAPDTGVIAQEVRKVLPEAVREAGDVTLKDGHRIDNMLVVNKERIFMENVGAVKELCRVTDNLENRIGQLERINKKLSSIRRNDSLKSTSTDNSLKSGGSGMRRCHRSCRQHPARGKIESCSSHFLQSSIVVLVVVMACCLMALATIWVMQWQSHLSHMRGAILIQMKSPPPWNDTSSTRERSQILSTLFPSITLTSSYENLSSTKVKTTRDDMHGVTPKHDDVFDDESGDCPDECPVFCCDDHFLSDAEEDPDEEMRHQVEKKDGQTRHSADPEQKNSVPSNDALQRDKPSNKDGVENGDHQSLSPRTSNIRKRMIETEDEAGETVEISRTESDPVLHLLELNVTLHPGEQCARKLDDDSSAVFFCAVNISRHFPHRNVTLSIRRDDSDAVMEYCGGSHYLSCPRDALNNEEHSTNNIAKREASDQRHTWQLPVGSFLRSRYRFRMTSQRFVTDQQICSFRPNYRPFTEYVLTFRRRCDK